jgi:crotonobetainyl-CoA:carnitine CoA-transferase CaiB-like acyl-CoA transferase
MYGQMSSTPEIGVHGESTRPLADVRIPALEQYGAGPWGSLQLSELGAEVIKIEDPRLVATWAAMCRPSKLARTHSLRPDGASPPRRKRGCCLFSIRGDQPDKLGLRCQDLKSVNPRIVFAPYPDSERRGRAQRKARTTTSS